MSDEELDKIINAKKGGIPLAAVKEEQKRHPERYKKRGEIWGDYNTDK
jgi:hypothetical protein